jgi:hypothetical protein
LERLARDFDLIFSTLRLERDYIDATDRRLTQLTFTRRTQPACPVVVARCGSSLVAERAGAELGERGRLPAAFSSKLFIRDMVRGSVGFVLEEPQDSHTPETIGIIAAVHSPASRPQPSASPRRPRP